MAEEFRITIKSFMDLVPTFNGEDPNGLTKFLQSTDALIQKGFNPQDPRCEQNQYILRFIRSKIVDKADQRLTPLDDTIIDYPTLRAALCKCYTDPRNLSTLIREANRTKQNSNESAESFAQRFASLRNAIHKRIRTEYPTSDGTLKAALDKMLVTSFLYEVQGSIGNYLRTRQPETAIEIDIEIANYSSLYRFEQYKHSSEPNPKKSQQQPLLHKKQHAFRSHDGYNNNSNFNNQNKSNPHFNKNPNPTFQNNRQFYQKPNVPSVPTPMSGVQTIRHQQHNLELEQMDTDYDPYEQQEDYLEENQEYYGSDEEANFIDQPPDNTKN